MTAGSSTTAVAVRGRAATMVTGRCGAVLAVGSAVPHAALTSGHDCAPTPLFALLNVLTLGCLLCAWHLWTRPTTRVWVAGAAMNAAMLTGHLVMTRTEHAAGPPALLAWAVAGSAVESAVTIAALWASRTRSLPPAGGCRWWRGKRLCLNRIDAVAEPCPKPARSVGS
ncbi:hypothetical protein [Nocardia sp. NPDC004722]